MMGTYQQLAKLNIQSLNVAGVQVNLKQKPVRNLGVMFDRNMTMSDQVKSLVRSVSYHTRNISRIRRHLTIDSTKKLVNSLALPHSVSRTLRSTDANLLHVPKSNSVKGDRAFTIAGPKVWNSLPSNIRAITNLVDFKKKLKTFFIGRLLCKAPVNLLETKRYINFNIIIIIINIIMSVAICI